MPDDAVQRRVREQADERPDAVDTAEPFGDQQAVVGTDGVVEDFLRVPYDPLYGARATGRVTGAVVMQPWSRATSGWLRVLGFMFAGMLLLFGVSGVFVALVADVGLARTTEARIFEALGVMLLPVPFGVAGGLLLFRLLRG